MSLIHNERTKLTATCLNTLTVAVVATGVVAPLVAVILGLPTSGTVSILIFVLATVTWFILGLALHLMARHILGRLEE